MATPAPRPSRKSRATGRRSPMASAALLPSGCSPRAAPTRPSRRARRPRPATRVAKLIDEGQTLFQANCASCHGLNAEGTDNAPTLIGVGAAAVDFQVGTGRMPMAVSGPQAEEKPAAVHRRAGRRSRDLRRLARPRPRHPRRALPRRRGRRHQRRRAVPHQLRDVPQRRRRGRRTDRGQVRAAARRRHRQARLRGDAHRPAEHAGLQRLQHHARGQGATSSPTSSSSRRTPRRAESTSATSAPSPRACSSGSSRSVRSSASRCG